MAAKPKHFISFIGILTLLFSGNIPAQTPLEYAKEMASSIMLRNPGHYKSWDYVTGTVLEGFEKLWIVTGDTNYYIYLKNTVDYSVSANSVISGYKMSDYNIDEIKEGTMCLFLYKVTSDLKYKKAADTLCKQMTLHPRTSEGGFWHKLRYPNQMWLDGLYMGSPFYAEYLNMFKDSVGIDDVVTQVGQMEKHMRDSVTGLLYHGWDESKTQDWADSITGCSPSFWGRAMGWYGMAIVDILDFLEDGTEQKDSMIRILNRFAQAVSAVQDTITGCWYQVPDKGNTKGNYLESSASCMFVYSLAKAVRMSYVDSSYIEIAKKGYIGIINEFISKNPDNSYNISKVCETAGLGYGRDGSYDYYINQTNIVSNDGKALGPFILAGIEMEGILGYIGDSAVTHVKINNTSIPFQNASCKMYNQIIVIEYYVEAKPTSAKIKFYDLYGKVLESYVIKSNVGLNRFETERKNLKYGIYLCSLSSGNLNRTFKMFCL